MLTKLTISNFRNIESLTLDPLGRITLIAGKNGVGKTAVLEALWLLSGPNVPELGGRVSAMRGLPTFGREFIFRDLFRNFDPEGHVKIVGHGDWGSHSRKLEIYFQNHEQFNVFDPNALVSGQTEPLSISSVEDDDEIVFEYRHDDGTVYSSRAWWVAEQMTLGVSGPGSISRGIRQESHPVPGRSPSAYIPVLSRDDPETIATRLGKLQLQGDDAKLMSLILPIEPRLERLILISIENTPVVHAHLQGMARPVPVHLLGEGLNRMLRLGLAMNEVKGGLLLVDEIENGLHHKIQKKVFATLGKLAEAFDVQIVATTHSGECIRAAHWALESRSEYELAYHRLDVHDGNVVAVGYDREMLDTAIEFNMGIR